MLAALIQKDGLRRLVDGGVATVATVAVASPAQPDAESIADWWKERAAIMEFDGGLSCDDAEQRAWLHARERFGLPETYRLH